MNTSTNAMFEGAMMPGMMGTMPMMGMMHPMMGMMHPMMGMMHPMMGMMHPMMCRMSLEMGKEGILCKMSPMEGVTLDMMRERCESMTKMLSAGMPMMMACGGSMMMGTMACK